MSFAARYRSYGASRAVVVHRAIYFLEIGFRRAVEAPSTSAHHGRLSRTPISRHTRHRHFATLRAVVPVRTRYTVSFVKPFYPVVVRTRRTLLRYLGARNAEMSHRTLARGDVSKASLVAVIPSPALLTLILENSPEQRTVRPLRTLEFKRPVLLHITTWRTVMPNRTLVRSSITKLADPPRLATSAVRDLTGRVAERLGLLRAVHFYY